MSPEEHATLRALGSGAHPAADIERLIRFASGPISSVLGVQEIYRHLRRLAGLGLVVRLTWADRQRSDDELHGDGNAMTGPWIGEADDRDKFKLTHEGAKHLGELRRDAMHAQLTRPRRR